MPIPEVTVLMAVYNGAKYLRQAVESILNQTFGNFEFIIIDDGSIDETFAILQGFVDSRLVLIRNKSNLGLTRSLNQGLALARGTYVARMDADDISRPSRLETQLRFLRSHPEIGVLGADVQVIDSLGKPGELMHSPARQHHALIWASCFCSPFAHPVVMMRREIVNYVGGYDPSFVTAQDVDLWHRLSRVTRLANLGEVLLDWRVHSTNVSNSYRLGQKHNAARVAQRLIVEILGQHVPFELCLSLQLMQFQSQHEAAKAVQLIRQLYYVFVNNPAVSRSEKRTILHDAGRQILYVVRPRLGDKRLWPAFLLACYLNPIFINRAMMKKIYRLAKSKQREGSSALWKNLN